MLATGEKTPTPARRAAPSSSSEPSPSTKKAPEEVLAPVPVPVPGSAAVDAGAVVVVGLVGMMLMPEGDSSSGDKTAAGMEWSGSGSGSPRTVVVGGPVESAALAILQSDLGGANEDLWEVEAVGSPRVRAMT
jgi:hypothetical protein